MRGLSSKCQLGDAAQIDPFHMNYLSHTKCLFTTLKAGSFCHQYKQQNYSHDLAKWQYLKRLKCSTESHISVPMKIKYFPITLVSNINFNLGSRFTKLVLQYVQRLSLSFLQTCSGFSKKINYLFFFAFIIWLHKFLQNCCVIIGHLLPCNSFYNYQGTLCPQLSRGSH